MTITIPAIDDLTLAKAFGVLILLSTLQIARQLRRNEQHLIAIVSLMLEEEDDMIEHDPFPIEGLEDDE